MKGPDRTPERLVGVAIAGAVALNFPLLYLFGGSLVAGIPTLFLYLFLVGAGLIAALALVIHGRSGGGGPGRDPPHA